MNNEMCPCGSQKKHKNCCYPYLSGASHAPNPEALMRSRYVAFCLGDTAYLKRTWHPETLPEDLEEEPQAWISLNILETWEEENEGEVEFKAELIYDSTLETLHETSMFEKIDGKWFYHSGEFHQEEGYTRKLRKTEICPCQSGKLFKNCHFKK